MKDVEKMPGTSADLLNILYLEDEVLIAFDVSELLQDLDVGEVTTTYKLSDAWDKARDRLPDVALLDINVDRGQNSFELGDHLKASGCAVIYASGNGTDAEDLRANGFHFIDKPFSHDGLSTLIQTVLAERVS